MLSKEHRYSMNKRVEIEACLEEIQEWMNKIKDILKESDYE